MEGERDTIYAPLSIWTEIYPRVPFFSMFMLIDNIDHDLAGDHDDTCV